MKRSPLIFEGIVRPTSKLAAKIRAAVRAKRTGLMRGGSSDLPKGTNISLNPNISDSTRRA